MMMREGMEGTERKSDKGVLADAACQELLTYGVWDSRTRVKQWIKKYLLRRQTAPQDSIFWTTGLLAAGLWQYRTEISEEAVTETDGHGADSMKGGPEDTGHRRRERIDSALYAYYERWMRKGCPVTYLDDLLAGEVILSAYMDYSESGHDNAVVNAQNAGAYWDAIEKLAVYGMSYPTDEMGSFPYRAVQADGCIFVDSIGLACPFLYRYGAAYHKNDAMELAVKQIVNFLAYGMDGSTGLPYHGYSMKTMCKYGIIGWGRAVGWLLRGMIGCMSTGYGRERLKDAYVQLVEATLTYQRGDGYFSWQLQAADGPADTSATGMICAALRQGIDQKILIGPKYEQALRAGRNAIRRSIRDGKVYDCSGECEGFGQYPQRYGAYPWALGSALMV